VADETEQKKAFARELVRMPDDVFRAATIAFPRDMVTAMKASNMWVSDDVVIEEVKKLKGLNENEFGLPSKEEHVGELYEIFRDGSLPLRERLVASDQITKIQGFVTDKKEQNTTINNKIMIVTKALTNEEWEKKAQINQDNLMKGIIEVKALDVTENADK
jgi:hypothetical protein